MSRRSDNPEDPDALREKIVGLGERSFRKSYYPKLQQQLQELERFRALLNQSNDAIFLMSVPSGAFLDVNESACRLLLYSRDQLLALSLNDVADIATLQSIQELLKQGQVPRQDRLVQDITLIKSSDERTPVEISIRLVAFGDSLYAVAAARDITERKKAEEALRTSEANYRAIFDSANDAIFVHDIHTGEVLSINKKTEEMYGRTLEELRDFSNESIFSGMPGYTAQDAQQWIRRAADGTPQLFEWLSRRKNGELFWIEVNLKRALIGGEPRLLAMVRDITDRKRVEEALKLTQFSVDHASVSAFLIDRDARILYANEQASRGLGYSREELLSMAIPDLDPNFPHSAWDAHWAELKEKGYLHFETLHRRKDGTLIPVNISVNYVSFGGREYNVAFGLDISERKKVEQELTRSYNITKAIIDSVNDAISLIDVRDFTIVAVNNAFLKNYGYSDQSEIAGKHCYAITHNRTDVCSPPDDICPLVETVKTKEHFTVDHVHYDKQGDKIYVEVSTSPIKDEAGNVIQVVHVQRDITERKRAEEALRISESRFRNLFKQSSVSILILSPEGRTIEVNPAFEELWGVRLDALKDYNILADAQLVAKGIMPYIQKGFAGEATEIPVTQYDPYEIDHCSRTRWVKSFIYPVKTSAGRIHQVVLMHWDVTEMVKAEEELRESEERFRAFFELAAVGAVQADPVSGRYLRVNDRFCRIMGYSREELLSKTIRDLTHPDDRELDSEFFEEIRKGELREYNVEKRYIHKDGHTVWGHVSVTIIRDSRGMPVRTAAIIQDITERKRMEEEMRHMAHHDVLTGLPNRRLFLDIATIGIAEARRNRKKLAVLFLDLDRFKEVNDTLGHKAGDELLKAVGERLKSSLRESDALARIGGDEFNIILSDITHTENIAVTARKIIDSFRAPYLIAGHDLHITTSIGISVYPDDSEEIDALFRYADIALYHAKELGKNTFQFYNSAINLQSLERMRMENRLRQTLEQGELKVYYQPQIDIATRKIVCVEALVRWQHPEMGLLDSKRFIPAAEETGFITTIDEWVLRTACTQIKLWQESGLQPPCVTVNLSSREFQNPKLIKVISKILDETGLSPDCLDLEISETTAMRDIESTIARLNELDDMGVHISIDDFGTGYSSLNYLKRLPIHRLKIDRSFIKDIATDPDDRAIIKAVTAMAHNMKMRVVAEGVETNEQLSFLHETKCDEAQGYLFNMPLSAEAFREVMAAHT